jgi:hypothetical protein
MEIRTALIYASLIALVAASQIVDVLGYKFRCNKDKPSLSTSTAIAGMLFYVARLGFMLYVTLQAILHEALRLPIHTLNKVTLCGVLLALGYLSIAKRHTTLTKITLGWMSVLQIFKNQKSQLSIDHAYSRTIVLDRRLLAYSFFINFFILFCNLLPVNLVSVLPNMGMSLVYLSQMLSVIAGVTWYILQEPKIVESLNASKFDACYYSLIFGKTASLIFTAILLTGTLVHEN